MFVNSKLTFYFKFCVLHKMKGQFSVTLPIAKAKKMCYTITVNRRYKPMER